MNIKKLEALSRESPFQSESGKNNNGLFIGLLKTMRKCDSTRVIVDRLTKLIHFIFVRVDYNATKLEKIYENEIVRIHGILISIMSNRGK